MNGLLVWFFGHLFNEITDFQGHLNSYLFSASFKKPTQSFPYLFCGCPVIWFFKVTLFILWVSWRLTMISSKEILDFVSGNLSLNPLFSFTFFGRFLDSYIKASLITNESFKSLFLKINLRRMFIQENFHNLFRSMLI